MLLVFSKFVYRLSLRLYWLAAWFISFFKPKAKLWINGQSDVFSEIENASFEEGDWVWFHCASVGEFEQAKPVAEGLRKNKSALKLIFTFFSPSGFSSGKKYRVADHCFFLPLDSPGNANRFLDLVNPVAVIFVKYEFWFFYLQALEGRNIPTFLISAIFRKEQLFFKRAGLLFRKMLESYTAIMVQDGVSSGLLKSIGLENVEISGDTRFDRVLDISGKASTFEDLERFCGDAKILVAGSTWPADEGLLIRYFNDQQPADLKMIIAPHELHEDGLKGLERNLKLETVRFLLKRRGHVKL